MSGPYRYPMVEAMSNSITAAVIIIGNEILSGRTKDENLGYMATKLAAMGIRLAEARVVADKTEAIVEAVNECRKRYTYVFTTGGIGPTHDDITARSVAAALSLPVERNMEAVHRLAPQYKPGDLNEARLSMADMPVGASLIDNPVSRAPGFQIENVFVLAGVPSIMRAMFDSLQNRLVGGAPIRSKTVACFLAEGTIAADLSALQDRFPQIDIGSYPFFRQGKFGTSLVLRGTDENLLGKAVEELRGIIRALGAEPVEAG